MVPGRARQVESVYEKGGMGPCVNGVVWCSGMAEQKYTAMVWSYGEKED